MAGEGKEKGREGGKESSLRKFNAEWGGSLETVGGRYWQGWMQGTQMTDTWISKTHLSKCHVISGPSPILGSFLPMPPMV